MHTYRLTGNYGTFVISKVVRAENEDLAWAQTGIMADLQAVGWHVDEAPDGEGWEVEQIDHPFGGDDDFNHGFNDYTEE